MDNLKKEVDKYDHQHEAETIKKLEDAKSVESDGILMILRKMWTKKEMEDFIVQIHERECKNCPRIKKQTTDTMSRRVILWICGIAAFSFLALLLTVIFGAVGKEGLRSVREAMPSAPIKTTYKHPPLNWHDDIKRWLVFNSETFKKILKRGENISQKRRKTI